MEQIPIFPLNMVFFPEGKTPLHIFEQRYRKMMRDRDHLASLCGITMIQSGSEVEDTEISIAAIGTEALLGASVMLPDGRYAIEVRGGRRFRIVETDAESEPYLLATVQWLPDPDEPRIDILHRAGRLRTAWSDHLDRLLELASGDAHRQEIAQLTADLPDDPAALLAVVAADLAMPNRERQRILELDSLGSRLRALDRIVRRESRLAEATGSILAPYAPSKRIPVN